MNTVFVSQRIDYAKEYRERSDSVDLKWYLFLEKCGLIPILVPNHMEFLDYFIRYFPKNGILITGGNDLKEYGGNTPERDMVELNLLKHAIENRIPVLGICRGMQVIQHHFGIKLKKITGHVTENQKIKINGIETNVNSYHNFGTTETNEDLEVIARASDNIVKAIKHKSLPIFGIMWHPERFDEFRTEDLDLMRDLFLLPGE